MKSFIQIAQGEKEFLIATSAIVSIAKNGEGIFITLNTVVDGFDEGSKGLAFDVPFEDIVSRLASDIAELKKKDNRDDAWLIA